MNRAASIAVVVGTMLWGWDLPAARAQQATTPEVVLVDVGYIFQNHEGFKAMRAELKAAVTQAETEVQAKRNQMRDLAKQLGDMQQGTPEYNDLETKLTKDQADLNVHVAVQRKKFIEHETKMMHEIYKEITDEVAYYCKQKGIRLAVRFEGDPVADDNPDEVIKLINRHVVFYDQAIDITPVILNELNQRAKKPTAARPTNRAVPLRR